jgi:hypothetical protein
MKLYTIISQVFTVRFTFTDTDTHIYTHTHTHTHTKQFRFLNNNTKCNPYHLNCHGNPKLSNFLFKSFAGDPPEQTSDWFYCVPEVDNFIPKYVPTNFWQQNELCVILSLCVCPLPRRALFHTLVKVKAVEEDRHNLISGGKY